MAANCCTRDWLDYTTLAFTIGGVLIVGVYTFVTYLQVSLTREALAETRKSNEATTKSNKIAERALVLGRRAWLFPEIKDISDNEKWLRVHIMNIGGVPGVVGRTGVFGARISKLPEQFIFTEDMIDGRQGLIVAADSKGKIAAGRLPPLGTEGDILFMVYYIEYTDVFKRKWKTQFAWFCDDGERDIWLHAPQFSIIK